MEFRGRGASKTRPRGSSAPYGQEGEGVDGKRREGGQKKLLTAKGSDNKWGGWGVRSQQGGSKRLPTQKAKLTEREGKNKEGAYKRGPTRYTEEAAVKKVNG